MELLIHLRVHLVLLEQSSKIHVDSFKTLVTNEKNEMGENVNRRQPFE